MSEIFSNAPFPRGPLLAAGGLVVAVVIAVAAVRLSGVEIRAPDAPAVVTQQLRFEDRADGSIAVLNASNALTLVLYGAPGTTTVLEFKTALDQAIPWQAAMEIQVPAACLSQSIPVTGNGNTTFYRARRK